ncbi:MAG: hypothetical protein P1V81_16385 [Planctomycetota bacterium]|nr:hypothetical protein [Planctomycetota bacterium]
MTVNAFGLQLLPLAIGVTLGALGVGWYLDFGSSESSRPAQRSSAPVVIEEGPAADPSQPGAAAPVGAPTWGSEAPATAHLRTAEVPRQGDLVGARLAALERAFRTGGLAPEALTELAANSLIDAGLPGEALDLLLEVGARRSWLFVSAGRSLARRGDRARAIEAFTAGIRVDPGSSSAVFELNKLDPLACLDAMVAAIAAGGLEEDRDSQANLASAMEAWGLEAEAVAVLQRQLEAGPRDRNLLARLERLDSGAYEAHLRGLIEAEPEDWIDDLAQHLIKEGRRQEALDLLDRQLDANPGDLFWIGTLEEFAPEQAYLALKGHYPGYSVSEEVGASFGSVGSSLWKAGKRDAAIDAWTTGALRCPLDSDGELDYEFDFYLSAPATLARALEQRRTPESTAVFHGDLADVLWQAGEPEQAAASWRRAAELDPGTWQVFLDRLAAGEDPL